MNFGTYNGVSVPNGLIRLNADGTLDTSFNSGGSGIEFIPSNGRFVNAVTVLADGKILVGGYFTSYNGVASGFLVRLNANGTRDTSYDAGGTGFDARVNELKVQADGKILAVGEFTSYNGAAAVSDGVVRLNADGSLDTSFNAGGSGSGGGFPLRLMQQVDGKILVGGGYTTYNGNAVPANLIRLNANGSLDTSFNAGGSGFDSSVSALYQLANGKILVGGYFTSYNGNTGISTRLVRLNADGSLDGTFNSAWHGLLRWFGSQYYQSVVAGR